MVYRRARGDRKSFSILFLYMMEGMCCGETRLFV